MMGGEGQGGKGTHTCIDITHTHHTHKVLKSMWVVLSDNLSLALSLLYSTLGLLLTGGSAVVNTVRPRTLVIPLITGVSSRKTGCVPDDPVLPVVLLG